MSCSTFLVDSPADQRRLQRTIEGGMGFSARHLPLANWKKSWQGSAARSMSLGLMPCSGFSWLKPSEAQTTRTSKRVERRIAVLLDWWNESAIVHCADALA